MIIFALMFLSIGAQAQADSIKNDSINKGFVRQYEYRHLSVYSELDKVFVSEDEFKISTIVFFNFNNSNNVKVVFNRESEVILYKIEILPGQAEDRDYTKFEGYYSDGTFITGAIGPGWLSFGAGDEMFNFTTWSDVE